MSLTQTRYQTTQAARSARSMAALILLISSMALAQPQPQVQPQASASSSPQSRGAVTTVSLEPGYIASGPTGGFLLSGTPSPMQYHNAAVLLRCQTERGTDGVKIPKQHSCVSATSEPIELNRRIEVPAGDYLLGFENMVYPGLIEVKAGETREVTLIPLDVAPEFGKASRITIFRDLTRLEEQRKIYFSEFMAGQPLFPLTMPDGFETKGLYPRLDETQKLHYQNARYTLCDQKPLPPLSPKAGRLCRMWKLRHHMALSEFFNFNADGSFSQYLLVRAQSLDGSTRAIDAKARRGARLLITPYNVLAAQFINVLPGAYSIEVASKSSARVTSVVVGYQDGTFTLDDPAASNEPGFGPPLDPTVFGKKSGLAEATQTAAIDPELDEAEGEEPRGRTCSDEGVLYKTEYRSYCRSTGRSKSAGANLFEPNIEGCDLNVVKYCEVLPVIK